MSRSSVQIEFAEVKRGPYRDGVWVVSEGGGQVEMYLSKVGCMSSTLEDEDGYRG